METTATMTTEVRIRTFINVRGRHPVPRPRYHAPIFYYAHSITARPAIIRKLLLKFQTPIFIFWRVTTTTDRQTETDRRTHTHTHGHGHLHLTRLLRTCTRVVTLIVETIYLQLIQNRYMFRSFTVLHCSHQHCVQPVVSDVEVVGYL